MRARYEEKTFENYFNVELAQRGCFFFPPGQVQEGSIGVDAIAMSRNRWLWRRLGHPYFFRLPFQGAEYREMAEEMEKFLQHEIANVPDIRCNVMFQYKRAEFMVLNTAAEWPHWNEPYFRYEIYEEQQKLLEALHAKFGSSVLILYAAPAVEDVSQLVDLHLSQNIIKNANFRPAHELAGHHRNTFIEAGGHSWACSDPVKLEAFDFDSKIKELGSSNEQKALSIKSVASMVHEVLSENPQYKSSFLKLIEYYGVQEIAQRAPIFSAYLTMVILKEITGIQWLVLHE